MLAQDTQGLNLRLHKLEVRDHWLIAITVFVIGVLVVMGALFAFNAVNLTTDEATAQEVLTIVDSGTTDGLDGVYTWSATLVDYEGVTHVGIDQIRAFIAADQAAGTQITSMGHPTTMGSVVSQPFMWSNASGYSGNGVMTSQFDEGLITYGTLVLDIQ